MRHGSATGRRGWARVGVAGLCLALGPAYAQPGDGPAAEAVVSVPHSDDPAAWLEEASVQARRVTGVGEQLTTALQLKGELLAQIAVMQEQLGQTDAAARNRKLVQLCVRALAHGGDDGWVHAAQAQALAVAGDEAGAQAALDKITRAAERQVAELMQDGTADLDAALRLADGDVSSGFASQLQTQTLRQDTRDRATALAQGSIEEAVAYVDSLEVPALRSMASIAIARVLLDPAPVAETTPTAEVINEEVEEQEAALADALPAEDVPDAEQLEADAAMAETPAPLIESEATETTMAESPETAAENPTPQDMSVTATDEAETTEAVEDVAVTPDPAADQATEPDTVAVAEVESETAPAEEAVVTEAAEEAVAESPTAETESAVALDDQTDSPAVETAAAAAVTAVPIVVGEDSEPENMQPEAAAETQAEAEAAAEEVQAEVAATEAPSESPAEVTEVAETQTSPVEPVTETQIDATTDAVENETAQPVAEVVDPAIQDTASAGDIDPEPAADSAPAPTVAVNEAVAPPVPPAPPTDPAVIVPSLRVLAQPDQVLDGEASPDVYDVKFTTTRGAFVVRVHRAWAPAAADRFHDLARSGYYHNQRFFRVVPGFVAQWGIHGFPKVAAAWRPQTFPDEPRTQPNRRCTIAFAAAAKPDTRTTQVYINLVDNDFLDDLGFAPFGEIVEGMDIVEQLFGGYGEAPSEQQRDIQLEGNALLDELFPDLDSIVSVRVDTAE